MDRTDIGPGCRNDWVDILWGIFQRTRLDTRKKSGTLALGGAALGLQANLTILSKLDMFAEDWLVRAGILMFNQKLMVMFETQQGHVYLIFLPGLTITTPFYSTALNLTITWWCLWFYTAFL